MSSLLMLRRFYCYNAASAASSSPKHKKPLVFLGSPQVSTTVLDALFNASEAPNPIFEDMFLSSLRALCPELCITAAYGNILPTKFLNIPSMGTVNIHPSLLPLCRGAAPAQRTLQDGAKEIGVSLAFTVHALDARPIIACERVGIDDQIKAPDLLALLFLVAISLIYCLIFVPIVLLSKLFIR